MSTKEDARAYLDARWPQPPPLAAGKSLAQYDLDSDEDALLARIHGISEFSFNPDNFMSGTTTRTWPGLVGDLAARRKKAIEEAKMTPGKTTCEQASASLAHYLTKYNPTIHKAITYQSRSGSQLNHTYLTVPLSSGQSSSGQSSSGQSSSGQSSSGVLIVDPTWRQILDQFEHVRFPLKPYTFKGTPAELFQLYRDCTSASDDEIRAVIKKVYRFDVNPNAAQHASPGSDASASIAGNSSS